MRSPCCSFPLQFLPSAPLSFCPHWNTPTVVTRPHHFTIQSHTLQEAAILSDPRKSPQDLMICLLGLESGISLASNIGRSAAGLAEEAGENWLNEGSEDDLGAVGDWEGHPKDQNELEHVVEGCYRLAASSSKGFRGKTYGTSRQH